MTRVTPGSRVREAIVRASSPASAGVVFIFQFAATITSRIGRNHARAADRRRRGGRSTASSSWTARSLDPLERPLDRRPVEVAAARRAPTGWPRASRDGRPRRAGRLRLLGRAGRRPRGRRSRRAGGPRRSPRAAGSPTPAFRTRLRSPRSARDTCRASSSSSPPAAPMRRRNVPTASPLFQVTTPRPRRIRHEAGSSMSASRAARTGASIGSTTNSRWVRPPARLSEPQARKRPRSQAVRQWSAACVPVERHGARRGCRRARRACGRPPAARHRSAPSPRRRDGAARRAGPPGPRAGPRTSRARPPRPSGRTPATGRCRPARHAGPGRGRVRIGSRDEGCHRGSVGRAGHRQAVRATDFRRAPLSRSTIESRASARRAGSWWWAFSGSTTSSRTSRGSGVTAAGQRSRTGSACQSPGPWPRSGCWRGPCRRCPAPCGRRAPRRARRGRSRRSRRPAWRRCRRRPAARGSRGAPRGCPG